MAIFEVQSPDGRTFEIEGPNQAGAIDAFRGFIGESGAEPQGYEPTTLDAATGGLATGLSFGFDDEIRAGIAAPVGAAYRAVVGGDEGQSVGGRLVGAYERQLENIRGRKQTEREQHPIASTAGEIAGAVTTGGGLAKGGMTLMNVAKPTVAGLAGRGALEGAAYGAAHGLGTGEGAEDRISRGLSGGAVGAATGGALGALAGRGASKAANKAVESVDDLAIQANVAYDAAERAGVIVSKGSLANKVQQIGQRLASEGMDATLHPKATAAFRRLQEASQDNVTFKGMDILRRVAKGAAKSMEADERRVASIIIEELDNFLGALRPQDVVQGRSIAAVDALGKARKLWGRMRKGEAVERLIEKAKDRAPQFSQSGLENALRTEFKQFLRNPKNLRGFTKAEVEAIRKVARGGPLIHVLRWLGKLSPRGVVSGMAGGAAGAAVGGLPGVAVTGGLYGLGAASQAGATAMRKAAANQASALTRAGGRLPPPTLPRPQLGQLEAAIAGSGSQAPKIGRRR